MALDWYDITFNALKDLWVGFLEFIPALIGALIVFIIGWFVAVLIGRIVSEVLVRLKFNELFDRTDWKRALEKAKFTVNPAEFLGAIVKWILVIVFLMAAVDILGLEQFSFFLGKVISYLPNIFIAALIFIVAIILADIAEKIVVATLEKMKLGYSLLIGTVVKWGIWVSAILAALYQLEIVKDMIHTLFTGLIALIVISVGLAFGLGGKDVAADILRELREKVKSE